jgi:ubiquinone/menaquinone biosynthesis C-methylase UbiE
MRTGLVTFAAARSVGPSGYVTGVDVSDSMLSVARNELSGLKSQESCWGNVEFYHHITRLKELEPIRGKKFNAITCASGLFLLDSPHTAIKS